MPSSTTADADLRRTPTKSAAMLAAEKVRFRRAVTLLGMTVVLPGSAQLVAGSKRTGRIAIGAFAFAFGMGFVLGLIALFDQSEIISLFTKPTFLFLLRFILIGYAVAWAWLLIDSWRIADPLGLARGQRLAMTGLNGVLCFSLTGGLLFTSHLVAVQRDFIVSVFSSHDVSAAEHGRYNVLLLGGDAGYGRVGLRPDSITVASIDEETGKTVLFGLPRNMAKVPFPEGSVMAEQFPNGFDCEGCYLNGVNTWAADHPDLFPKSVKDPGMEATTEAVEAITGLHINYYAMVDLQGFQHLVDAVGGVTMTLKHKIPIGSVGRITDWIPAGTQKLTGYQTLWYARSRALTDDYSRMARQKCVMNAMLQQLDPKTVVLHFGAIAKAGKQLLETSIPASELDTLVDLALQARSKPIATVSFVPPKINTGDPDWALIKTMVTDAIDKSEGDGSGGSGAHYNKKHHGANDSANLANAC